MAHSTRPETATKKTALKRTEWLRFPEAMDYLQVSERWLRRACAQHLVRHYKHGKFLRFRREDLDSFMEAGAVEVSRSS